MKLKTNRGYVGVDISIAIVILLFMVPTIMGIVYAINSSKISTQIKSEATSILVNTIETAKGMGVENVEENNIFNELKKSYDVSNIENNTAVIKTDTASYKLQFDILDYADTNTNNGVDRNKVKTVTATVYFKIRNSEKNMSLKTVIK